MLTACIGVGETLRQAGHRMRDLGVTALQVRGEDGSPRGIISQDMIVREIAAGGDPKYITVGELTMAVLAPAVPALAQPQPSGPLGQAQAA